MDDDALKKAQILREWGGPRDRQQAFLRVCRKNNMGSEEFMAQFNEDEQALLLASLAILKLNQPVVSLRTPDQNDFPPHELN